MKKILFLSNGHGEDLSASLLAKRLVSIGYKVDGLPIVGKGDNYSKQNIQIIGKTKNFETGGLGYNSLKGRFNDLINGQLIYFLRKLFLVLQKKDNYDYLIVVGDIVPLFFAWIVRKNSFVYLVAYSSHYEGKLILPWPCKHFLNSKKVLKIFSRDLHTANDLTNQLGKKVYFYGNPFMEKLLSKNYLVASSNFNIALFPGSRMPELTKNFLVMLDVLENISSYGYCRNVEFNFGFTNHLKQETLERILKLRKWKSYGRPTNFVRCFEFGLIKVNFKWNAFENILCSSNLVISMAGTAAEQAIGCSKPVIQIEGEGPQFTKSFADAQRRLLGDFVFCVTKYKDKNDQIEKTVSLIFKLFYFIKLDKKFLISCNQNSLERIGPDGACTKIVNEINQDIIHEEDRK